MPISATIYSVLGGTFNIDGILSNMISSGDKLNINESVNAYQGFGEILAPFMFSGFNVNVQTTLSVNGVLGDDAQSGTVIDGVRLI